MYVVFSKVTYSASYFWAELTMNEKHNTSARNSKLNNTASKTENNINQ